MTEDLIGYFSSVVTRQDISSLPVTDTNIRTPEMVLRKI